MTLNELVAHMMTEHQATKQWLPTVGPLNLSRNKIRSDAMKMFPDSLVSMSPSFFFPFVHSVFVLEQRSPKGGSRPQQQPRQPLLPLAGRLLQLRQVPLLNRGRRRRPKEEGLRPRQQGGGQKVRAQSNGWRYCLKRACSKQKCSFVPHLQSQNLLKYVSVALYPMLT